MFSSFFYSKKWAMWAYGGFAFIVLLLIFQTYLNLQINDWYKNFYDIMQNIKDHTIDDFWASIRIFIYIVMPYILVRMIISFFSSHWVFRWREAMTFDYLKFWQKSKKDIEGSSQRMQEDIYRFGTIMESLGVQILDSIMTLIAFTPILWELSKKVELDYIQDIPGSLVWIALFVSIGGLILSWLVGIKLPNLEYNNQKVEAAFRKELVYAEEDKINYADTKTITELFIGLKFNYSRLFLHYGYFNIWLYSFSQILVIVPYIIMGEGLFTGLITLGILVQVSNAFSQVRSSFSIFIDNWKTITELRSIHKRLKEFEISIEYKKK
ncbi:long-chain fatty acid ABC transporter, fused permease and ATPase components, SbmA family [Campylobacter pinnipediorum subsp. caledonicus]|uniref:Long-chain fatty acid ABC transporter, fused permease and ATPase components, SbmA family n=1 Tax=Campylobacter pinnipediorum subsp. caledonicus TaxID=1874362 RepID=A0A1S6U975_9BACT|nr:putative transporter [Campylobacter pinnipediorum]AQW86344.1 long-chain fatty acid ABC transporter, fused permease and ATPase components, SbmA family [Campylobacter pinnipediorum subsp. caledonicus]AQW87997.1 long-chain fatty acid ABC transporter, fused permease and ATPase components, SbmA family [Campylobacter pinnipediorum subsp. caledonicus]OPA71442.1 transporter [Campylobacter pinnipediorum subsp. caledonicus]